MSYNSSPSPSLSNSYQMQTSSTNNSREYCLRWNNHQPNLAAFFGNLYASESFVDVTLVAAEGKKVLAHKLVLSACSPYFQHVFETNPCKHPVVILKDVQYSDLVAIVKFIYNGEVNISQDRINTILKTANSLQVKGLAEVPADELKRVSTVVGEPVISAIRSHYHTPPLTNSVSWDASDSLNDIPRKKLKKSASATASYISGSSKTNGDHSGSIDSGVGASVSRSMDDGCSVPLGPDEVPIVLKRPSIPAPPPLLPKSKSLDHNFHRDAHDDLDMNMPNSDRQSYDDSSVGLNRGYDLEVADLKIEEEMEDEGEIEYLEDDEEEYYDEESYFFENANDNDNGSVGPQEMKKSLPQLYHSSQSQSSSSSSACLNPNREVLRVSSAAGERRRRGRPLLRQPRIKRSDNEPTTTGGGREQFDLHNREHLGGHESESSEPNGQTNTSSVIYEDRTAKTIERQSSINQSNLPIVRVSQCSPTPPSSPPPNPSSPVHNNDELQPVIVSTILTSSTLSGSTLPSSSMIITPTSQAPTLLKVPSTESQPSSLISGSGNHLVKQISQPLLPSHSLTPLGGITTGNPVIRRQNSTPASTQQSRIIQPLKQGTVFQILPTLADRTSLEEGSSKTYIIDLVSSGPDPKESDVARRELKRESSAERSNSFSREDSITDEIGSTSSSFDEIPVNRSGHCPALRPGPALGCNFCWNSVDNCGRILRRKTKYHCPECHINLCIVPCFQEYHEKADKKKKPRSKLGLPKPNSM